ncbi:MAG: response regulator transcription factor [Kineosporiaceae bacterium]
MAAWAAVRLMLLEDDDGIRTLLRLALEDEGYDVVEFARAEDALAWVPEGDPAVMLVDLMLGGMDGLTFVHRVRRTHAAPIVVVSARSDAYDIVAALEAGADDYVTKPFDVTVVAARLRALRRRAQGGHGPDAESDAPGRRVVLDASADLALLPDAGQVRKGGQEVHLTLTEFRVLCELAASPGRVLSRQALLERVWDHGFFGDERIVDVHIRRLRTKIETDPGDPRVITTVRGLGYRLDLR